MTRLLFVRDPQVGHNITLGAEFFCRTQRFVCTVRVLSGKSLLWRGGSGFWLACCQTSKSFDSMCQCVGFQTAVWKHLLRTTRKNSGLAIQSHEMWL